MCNAYEQHVRWVEYCQMMQALELEIPTQQTELDLPQADDATKSDAAKMVGKAIAAQLKAKGVTKIVFDRNGYLYHGRIKALAEAAREAGLEF